MTDIPEDIRAKAFKIADGWAYKDEERDDMQADIARAILAERERCASQLEELIASRRKAFPKRYVGNSYIQACINIIRTPTTRRAAQ